MLAPLQGIAQALAALLVCTVWSSPAAQAQTPEAAAQPAVQCPPQWVPLSADKSRALAAQAQDRGMLWRIDHQGRSAWLYGTLHVGRAAWVHPGPTVRAALQRSDSLALEIDLRDPQHMAALGAGLRANPQAAPLPPALAARLALQHRSVCNPLAQMQALRPEAQLMVVLAQLARRQGMDPDHGIDASLAEVAQQLDKPVWSLETVQIQLREMVSDDPAEVQRSVRKGLAELEKANSGQQLVQLSQAWARGDTRRLERYPDWCDCMHSAEDRADYTRLIAARNPAMARQVAARLRMGQTPFVAVGALHLVGPQGLPALLRAEGFRVQRVPLNAVAKKSDPKPASAQ